jgi:hypothetical protein
VEHLFAYSKYYGASHWNPTILPFMSKCLTESTHSGLFPCLSNLCKGAFMDDTTEYSQRWTLMEFPKWITPYLAIPRNQYNAVQPLPSTRDPLALRVTPSLHTQLSLTNEGCSQQHLGSTANIIFLRFFFITVYKLYKIMSFIVTFSYMCETDSFSSMIWKEIRMPSLPTFIQHSSVSPSHSN